MNANKNKITIKISTIYLLAAWTFGFFFTLGITMHAGDSPLTLGEQFAIITIGYIIWPGALGLYIAKLLGTY